MTTDAIEKGSAIEGWRGEKGLGNAKEKCKAGDSYHANVSGQGRKGTAALMKHRCHCHVSASVFLLNVHIGILPPQDVAHRSYKPRPRSLLYRILYRPAYLPSAEPSYPPHKHARALTGRDVYYAHPHIHLAYLRCKQPPPLDTHTEAHTHPGTHAKADTCVRP